MVKYWANFTRTGNPNGDGLPEWPAFTTKSQDYLAFTDHGAAAKTGLRRPYCELFLQAVTAGAFK
jgi:para-nitrobenzyl esterase